MFTKHIKLGLSFVFGLSSLAIANEVDLMDELKAYWSFNSNYEDYFEDRSADVYGQAVRVADDKVGDVGRSLYLNGHYETGANFGNSSFVVLQDNSDNFDLEEDADDEVTIAFWYKPAEINHNDDTTVFYYETVGTSNLVWKLVQKNNGDLIFGFSQTVSGNPQFQELRLNGPGGDPDNEFDFFNGSWNHICLVFVPGNPGHVKRYINGVEKVTNQNYYGDFPNGINAYRMRFGVEASVMRPWSGHLDEFAIWSRNLSQADIDQLIEDKQINIELAPNFTFDVAVNEENTSQVDITPHYEEPTGVPESRFVRYDVYYGTSTTAVPETDEDAVFSHIFTESAQHSIRIIAIYSEDTEEKEVEETKSVLIVNDKDWHIFNDQLYTVGKVGIGKEAVYELDVAGKVSADSFVLADGSELTSLVGIKTPWLDVPGGDLRFNGHIGIGFSEGNSPNFGRAIHANGAIEATSFIGDGSQLSNIMKDTQSGVDDEGFAFNRSSHDQTDNRVDFTSSIWQSFKPGGGLLHSVSFWAYAPDNTYANNLVLKIYEGKGIDQNKLIDDYFVSITNGGGYIALQIDQDDMLLSEEVYTFEIIPQGSKPMKLRITNQNIDNINGDDPLQLVMGQGAVEFTDKELVFDVKTYNRKAPIFWRENQNIVNIGIESETSKDALKVHGSSTISGDLNVQNELLHVKSGKVGIGGLFDPAPDKLQVDGDVRVSGQLVANRFIGDGSGLHSLPSTSHWDKDNGNVNYPNGRVGIGKANPVKKLDVDGSIMLSSDSTWEQGATARLFLGPDENSSIQRSFSGVMSLHAPTDGNIYFHIGTGTGSQKMSINADSSIYTSGLFRPQSLRVLDDTILDGNVGIGTDNPTEKLDVMGNIKSSGSVTAASFHGDGSALTGIKVWNTDNSPKISYNDGFVGIGSTDPTEKLDVTGNIKASGDITAAKFYGDGTELAGASQWDTHGETSINYADGAVGIGRENPTKKLDVSGSIMLSSDTPWSEDDAKAHLFLGPGGDSWLAYERDEEVSLRAPGGLPITFELGSDHEITISGEGYLGIGSSNPSNALEIIMDMGPNERDQGIYIQNTDIDNGHAAGITIANFHNEINRDLIRLQASAYHEQGHMLFKTRTDDTIGLTEKMRLTSGGRLGIGTEVPTEMLDVVGNIKASGEVTAMKYYGDGSELSGIKVWSKNDTKVYYNEGYVGIGRDNPAKKLDVKGSIVLSSDDPWQQDAEAKLFLGPDLNAWLSHKYGTGLSLKSRAGDSIDFKVDESPILTIHPSGNVGIGTSIPKSNFEINTNMSSWGEWHGGIRVINSFPGGHATGITLGNNFQNIERELGRIQVTHLSPDLGNMIFLTHSNDTDKLTKKMVLTHDGKLGLGTDSPSEELEVVGVIKAQKVKVRQNGADFVFEDDYNLPTIQEVEAHIKAKKHLPGVAPAKHMEEHGVEVSEMQQTLLQKVEELTLYIIQQNKRIESLEAQLKQ